MYARFWIFCQFLSKLLKEILRIRDRYDHVSGRGPFQELSESSVSVEDINSDANAIDGVTGADCVAIIEGSRGRKVYLVF